MRLFLVSIMFFLTSKPCFSQVNPMPLLIKVLESGQQGKSVSFSNRTGGEVDSLVLTFLGIVEVKAQPKYKVINSMWYWGPSVRATPRVVIYDMDNQYLGDYTIGMVNEMPTKVSRDLIVFDYPDPDKAGKSCHNEISFAQGIPESLFISCDGKKGDLFSFGKNL